jgi:hypothetical protein
MYDLEVALWLFAFVGFNSTKFASAAATAAVFWEAVSCDSSSV